MCRKLCRSNSDLNLHRLSHIGVKPLLCPICKLSFLRNSDLDLHLKMHSKERLDKFPVCGISFQESTSKIHISSSNASTMMDKKHHLYRGALTSNIGKKVLNDNLTSEYFPLSHFNSSEAILVSGKQSFDTAYAFCVKIEEEDQ